MLNTITQIIHSRMYPKILAGGLADVGRKQFLRANYPIYVGTSISKKCIDFFQTTFCRASFKEQVVEKYACIFSITFPFKRQHKSTFIEKPRVFEWNCWLAYVKGEKYFEKMDALFSTTCSLKLARQKVVWEKSIHFLINCSHKNLIIRPGELFPANICKPTC